MFFNIWIDVSNNSKLRIPSIILRPYSLNCCISCVPKIKCCIFNNWNVDICLQIEETINYSSFCQFGVPEICHVIWYQQLLIGGYMYLCKSCCPWGLSDSQCYRNTSLQWVWPDTWSHMTAADSRFYLKKQSTTLYFLEISKWNKYIIIS